MARLVRFTHRWRWTVIGAWAALAVTGGVLLQPAGTVTGGLTTAEPGPGAELVVAVVSSPDPYSPALEASVARVAADLAVLPGVRSVQTPYASGIATVRVELSQRLDPPERSALVDRVTAALHGIDAPHVLVGGALPIDRELTRRAVRDAVIGPGLAVLAAFLGLLLLARGSVRARLATAAAPTAAALVTAVAAVAAIRFEAPGPGPVLVALLGLTLAVGYALAVLERYRKDRSVADAGTAARPVLGAAALAAAALAGLAVLREPVVALAAAAMVAVATAAALTLVPAVIAVVGGRIPPSQPPAVFTRLGTFARRRAAPTTLALTIGLLLLAAPFLDGSRTGPDARSLPASAEARQADEALRRAAGPGEDGVVTVEIEAPAASDAVRDYLNDLERLDGVTTVRPRPGPPDSFGPHDRGDGTGDGTNDGDGTAVVDLAVAEADARGVVRAVRALQPPFPTRVGGPAARVLDAEDQMLRRLPWAVLIVVAAGLLVLAGLSGSPVTPLPALVLSGLTYLATLGVLVVVFPWGLGKAVLGLDPRGLAVTTPVLLAPLVLGLSLGQHALGHHVRGHHVLGHGAAGHGAPRAVAGVVVAALGLAVLSLPPLLGGGLAGGREIAFGLTIAALVDLVIVRGLLVPAIRQLLGDRMAPGPLHPDSRSASP